MRFNLMSKNRTIYFTELNEKPIQIQPLEEVTFIILGDHKYVIPYGLDTYKQLANQLAKNSHDVDQLFKATIKVLNVSPYGHNVDKLILHLNELKEQAEKEDALVFYGVMINALSDYQTPMIDHEEWKDLVDDIIETGNLELSPSAFYDLEKQESPEIHNEIIPTLMELIKQVDQQGLLDDLSDPTEMLKAYYEGK